MEVVDDITRKNSVTTRLTKAKSEATTRARTALENEFITQGATAVSRNATLHEEYSEIVSEMTLEKIKQI